MFSGKKVSQGLSPDPSVFSRRNEKHRFWFRLEQDFFLIGNWIAGASGFLRPRPAGYGSPVVPPAPRRPNWRRSVGLGRRHRERQPMRVLEQAARVVSVARGAILTARPPAHRRRVFLRADTPPRNRAVGLTFGPAQPSIDEHQLISILMFIRPFSAQATFD